MRKSAYTEPAKIEKIQNVLLNLKELSPAAYVFFSLVYTFGLKQEDIFHTPASALFTSDISEKYPDIDLSSCTLLDYIPKADRAKPFREILPSRDYLFKLLNKAARMAGFSDSLNVSILQKTWAYLRLCDGEHVSIVMSHFSYKNGEYRFLTEYLGLSFYDCCEYDYLGNLYAHVCFSELSKLDYTQFPEEKQLEFLALLRRILNLFGLLK